MATDSPEHVGYNTNKANPIAQMAEVEASQPPMPNMRDRKFGKAKQTNTRGKATGAVNSGPPRRGVAREPIPRPPTTAETASAARMGAHL
jgi:hypothetical protein